MMIVEIKPGEQRLHLVAQSASDLEVLWQLAGRLHPHVERVITEASQVPFYDPNSGLGLAWMVRGKPVRVMTGLVVRLDWLHMVPPADPAQESRANAAARIGNALLDGIQGVGLQQH